MDGTTGITQRVEAEEGASQLKTKRGVQWEGPDTAVPNRLSMHSEKSMGKFVNFSEEDFTGWDQRTQEDPCGPIKQGHETDLTSTLTSGPSEQHHQTDLTSTLTSGPSEQHHPTDLTSTFTSGPSEQHHPTDLTSICTSGPSEQHHPTDLTSTFTSGPSEQHHPTDLTSTFTSGPSEQHHPTDLTSIFTLLEHNVFTFVKKELKKFQRILSSDDPECLGCWREEQDEEEEKWNGAREACLKIALHFMKKMRQQELADSLENNSLAMACQQQLKKRMREQYKFVFEGIAKEGKPTLLNHIYTDLYNVEGGRGKVNAQHEVEQIAEVDPQHKVGQRAEVKAQLEIGQRAEVNPQHEVRQSAKVNPRHEVRQSSKVNPRHEVGQSAEVKAQHEVGQRAEVNTAHEDRKGRSEVKAQHKDRQTKTTSMKTVSSETPVDYNNIFQPRPGRDQPIRTVLTKGVAGVGKTISTQKFTLDWAEGKANQNIQFTFPFSFREINLLKEERLSLIKLIHTFFIETKDLETTSFLKCQAVFVFDGLDECQLPLDFKNNEICTDVTEPTSVDVLLTNLIKGNLLPSARLWITTRPAAANRIPPECVGMVTEVHGFNGPQKDEYLRKRFRDKNMGSRVLSHVNASRSLRLMCHIPVFCWITATVLENTLASGELPGTLTELYIHFLVFQSIQGSVKYHRRVQTDPYWNAESREAIMSLGKLAFQQLEKGNLIFYGSDLTECSVDVGAASLCSGVLTQVFREERGLYQSQEKVFSFVHLSVQEFLAALYVFLTFFNCGVNLLGKKRPVASGTCRLRASNTARFYQDAVNKALQSENGHMDLFLRFLLGLSVETNQTLLQGLLTQTGRRLKNKADTAEDIKKRIRENLSPEKSINLFHCLNELNDHSLVEEVQRYLSWGSLSREHLSPAQWSALVFVLLMSEEELDVFDLRRYSPSEEGLLRLLPVVRASRTALLSGCHLTAECCARLASALGSSTLRVLDLSSNDLGDPGVRLLSDGLGDPQCHLETLRLSGCLVTEEGCAFLVSALNSNPSHLRELDLSYNHPGSSGRNLLSALLDDPECRLDKLIMNHCGKSRIRSGPRKYGCDLTLDPDTAQVCLSLTEGNRTATVGTEAHPYPDHPERFYSYPQVLCREGLTGSRWYWEVEWSKECSLGVTYRGIDRKGTGYECALGYNDKSWAVVCNEKHYTAWHDTIATVLSVAPSGSTRVGVYLDCPAGSLSFYRVSSDTLTLLHTFHSAFAEPLYPGFGVYNMDGGSSVSLAAEVM